MPAFQEWIVIAFVALVVLGPDRLPRVARTAGQLLARFRSETRRNVEELKRIAEVQDLERELQGLRQELRGTQEEVARTAGVERDRGRHGGKRRATGSGPSANRPASGRVTPSMRPSNAPPPVDPEAT